MSKISFALVGTGNIGAKYPAAIANIEDAELTGVVDVMPGRAELFAKTHGIPFPAQSLKEMVKKTPNAYPVGSTYPNM